MPAMPHSVQSAVLLALSSLALTLGQAAYAQTATGVAPAASVSSASVTATHISGAMAPSPAARGINFTLGGTFQHSSVTGSSWFTTPDVSYRANRILSFDASIPWYGRVEAFKAQGSGTSTTYALREGKNLLGDAVASGHLSGEAGDFSAALNASGAFPTGNKAFGLSAGVPTYNVTSHFEYSIWRFNPDVEAGIGTSSRLVNNGISRSYTAAGRIANFQAGTSIDLPRRLSLEVDAYEALPLTTQTVYGSVTHRHGRAKGKAKGNPPAVTVLSGAGMAEDNGITAEFDVPITRHLSFGWMYDHSLIQDEDVTGFTLTWVVRAPRREQ